MKEKAHILIVPDVHGRAFWRDIENIEHDFTVFLGDYLDPYPNEWDLDQNYNQNSLRLDTIENFKQIIDYKKNNQKTTILLLGNHDCGYIYGNSVCDCRTDHTNYQVIRSLFLENKEYFDLAWKVNLAGKDIIFSHAGILKDWIKEVFENYDDSRLDVIARLNNLNQVSMASEDPEFTEMKYYLSIVDSWRGGYSDVGSCVWSDIRSILQEGKETYPPGMHIFGHTQLKDKIIEKSRNIACLDCRRVFGLTEIGEIIDYGE